LWASVLAEEIALDEGGAVIDFAHEAMSCATARPSTIQLKLAKAIGRPIGGGLVSPDRTPLCGFSLASVREGPFGRW
jgi:hypothetical protein